MKKIGMYTSRGQTTEPESTSGNPKKIILFDGRFDTGYKITAFHIWSGDYGASADPDVVGKLTTSPVENTAADGFMDASDQREIAWAGSIGAAETFQATVDIIDRDNLVIEDLYVYARCPTAGAPINYLIEMDKYDITEWQGALTMAKDKAQG